MNTGTVQFFNTRSQCGRFISDDGETVFFSMEKALRIVSTERGPGFSSESYSGWPEIGERVVFSLCPDDLSGVKVAQYWGYQYYWLLASGPIYRVLGFDQRQHGKIMGSKKDNEFIVIGYLHDISREYPRLAPSESEHDPLTARGYYKNGGNLKLSRQNRWQRLCDHGNPENAKDWQLCHDPRSLPRTPEKTPVAIQAGDDEQELLRLALGTSGRNKGAKHPQPENALC